MPTVQSRGETCRHCRTRITRTRGAFFGDDDSLFCPATAGGRGFHDPMAEEEAAPTADDLTDETGTGETPEAVKRRLRYLLDLAEDPRTPKAEAESASAAAERLMLKWSITRAQAAQDDESKREDLVEHVESLAGVPYKVHKRLMMLGIARTFGVYGFWRGDDVVLTGARFNIDQTLRVFGSVVKQGDNFSRHVTGEASRWDSRSGAQRGANTRARNAWWAGYTTRIVERVDEQRQAAATELGIEGRKGTALVLMSEFERAEREAKSKYRLRTVKGPAVNDRDAFTRGRADADRATIRR